MRIYCALQSNYISNSKNILVGIYNYVCNCTYSKRIEVGSCNPDNFPIADMATGLPHLIPDRLADLITLFSITPAMTAMSANR